MAANQKDSYKHQWQKIPWYAHCPVGVDTRAAKRSAACGELRQESFGFLPVALIRATSQCVFHWIANISFKTNYIYSFFREQLKYSMLLGNHVHVCEGTRRTSVAQRDNLLLSQGSTASKPACWVAEIIQALLEWTPGPHNRIYQI